MSGGSFDPALATSPLWNLIGGGKRDGKENVCSLQPCQVKAPLTCSACQAAFYCSRLDKVLRLLRQVLGKIFGPLTCRDHQRAHWSKHKSSCSPFTLRNSKTRGRHLVASRAIARGEVILEVWVLLLKMRVLKFSLFRSPQSLRAHSSIQPLFVLVAIVRLPYLGPGLYLGSM